MMNDRISIPVLTRCDSRGFTFVEILAAMLFMAIVIPVTIQGITIANRAGIVAERKRLAGELANRKLTEILLEDTWRDGDQEGDFEDLGEDQPLSYTWKLSTTAWEEDAMRLITLEVFYKVQEREYSVSLSTLAPEAEESAE